VIHDRHFTVDEANALIAQIEPMVRRLREARDDLADADAHSALGEAAPTNGGGAPGRKVG
jgi:hypothetical protein